MKSCIYYSATAMLAPMLAPEEVAVARAHAEALTLIALRALGVVDARARGLVVQSALPEPDDAST